MDKALQIQAKVKEILGGAEVHLVGGAVRDLVLGKEPKDWDFNTPLSAEEVEKLVKAAGRRAYTTGARFGTIGFKVEVEETNDYGGGDPGYFGPQWHSAKYFVYIEVTTYRGEKYTPGSRKPEVTFIDSLYEDLSRRDFTINAMALNDDGTIYDPFGGQLDILVKQIKSVGLPKDRINDDPLRILRAARFASQLGFMVEPNLLGKARQLSHTIVNVSRERWVQEIDKLLMGEYHHGGIDLLEQMGVLRFILPEISFMLNQWKPIGNKHEQAHYTFDMEASHANPIFFAEDNVDERWKKWLARVSMPASRKYKEYGYISYDQQDKIAREINIGICHRLKFSNERTKHITG